MSGAWITGPNSFIGPRPQGYFTFRTLLGQIVTSGTTPHLYLIKKYAWILICMVVLPPVLHDIYDYLTPLTPAQQLDLDRSQRRLLYKLRHAIGGWKIHTIDPSETGRSADAIRKFLEAFREDFAANWEGDGRVRIEKSGLQTKRVKSKHIEESLKEVEAQKEALEKAQQGAPRPVCAGVAADWEHTAAPPSRAPRPS